MGEWLPVALFLTALSALLALGLWTKGRQRRREHFLAGFDFAGLLDQRLARRHPELDARQRRSVFEGLRAWFAVCLLAGRRKVSMPSQAVDDAWHEFILFTRNYQAFCHQALGRFLHHVPAEAMASPTQASDGLKRTWKLACRQGGIDPRAPAALPLLFAIDGQLGLADGFRYELDCLARGGTGNGSYCASGIGCSSCSSCGGDSGCSSGCGGD
ncbi:MAG: hypothetical protein KDH20_01345 [Rhodocyclaceae bacterium]|nr:hypothetical protein [Rhodocyclaceae bacterium]